MVLRRLSSPEDGGGPALRFSGVVHRYRSILALDHLDLEVARGETLALLGPNGAGQVHRHLHPPRAPTPRGG